MDIEARREARRRKILENGDSRLKKITGVEDRTTKSEIDVFTNSNCITSSTSSANSNSENVCIGELVNSDNDVLDHIGGKGYPRCYYVIVISVISNLLLTICNTLVIDTKSFHINKIFIPFITFEIIYFCFASDHSEPPALITILSVINSKMSVFNPVYLQASQKYLIYIFRIVQDMLVYFFIFILCYSLLHAFI